MIFSPSSHTHRQAGYALIVTMCFLVVSLIVFGSVMYWAATGSTNTQRNNLFNQSESAAESATEVVVTYMQRDFTFQSLNPSATYYASLQPSQTGWPQQFQFSDTNGNANMTTVVIGVTNWSILNSQFAGLYGLGQTVDVYSVASPLNVSQNLSATVFQELWFGTIPVFQFAIFYNLDCEINPGNDMVINGRVHSNQNIFTTGSSAATPLTYSSYVEASLAINLFRMPNDPNGVRTGNVIFNITNNNPLNNYESLTLPIGTNNTPTAIHAILEPPPAANAAPNPAAYYQSNLIYTYNLADLIISNGASGGTNITVYYENQNNTTVLTPLAPDATNKVSGVATNVYYSYLTNVSFYDYREGDTVKALQLDVSKLNQWLTNTTVTGGYQYNYQNTNGSSSKGHGINGIYVNNAIQPTGSIMPAVRVVNGQQLPVAGLTVATPEPLYVKGNYNTTTNGSTFALNLGSTTNNTVPAALMGDAITVLSSNWSDAYNTNTALSSRTPVTTTINAACLEGIVPTQVDTSGTWHYSGGVENFLRLLENWGGTPLNYNGSIVVMFNSEYATNFWSASYYGVPTRYWGFDVNFTNPSKIPPMCPQVRAMVRSIFSAY